MIPLVLIGGGLLAVGLRVALRGGSPVERAVRNPDDDAGTAMSEADALARVITSEAGTKSLAERVAVGWAVRNSAAKSKKTIIGLVCTPTCGRQWGGVRKFSSRQPATAANLKLAAQILAAPKSADPTKGATHFFEPREQDRLVAQGLPGYRFNSAQLRQRWLSQGSKPRGAVGAFEFFA